MSLRRGRMKAVVDEQRVCRDADDSGLAHLRATSAIVVSFLKQHFLIETVVSLRLRFTCVPPLLRSEEGDLIRNASSLIRLGKVDRNMRYESI